MRKMFLAILLMFTAVGVFGADEWPQHLGPNRDGVALATGVFGDQVTLERTWIQPLGSGFSGIVVGKGKLYTMHAATDKDVLTCLNAETGERIWRYAYGESFPKVGNSEPGPLSTPILDGELVFGLGARGELFALKRETGEKVWQRNLINELGAVMPRFGMTSSPLISGNLLILNAGDGKNKGIVALNKTNGELVWNVGAEKTEYQSPALVTLLAQEQVVTLSETHIRGLQPQSGKVIWEAACENCTQTIALNDNTIITDNSRGFAAYQLTMANNQMTAAEVWTTKNLDLGFDMPTLYKDHLYGFKGGSMVCADAKSGDKVWASRTPGRGMAILVDGHLGMICQDGKFRVVQASTQGYQERAEVEVFERPGLTEPSFANGVFYIRSYSQIAAVSVK